MNIRLLAYSFCQVTIIAVICSYFGQILLKIVDFNQRNYLLLLLFLIPIFLFTKFSNKLVKANISISYFIDNEYKKVSKIFIPIIIINTLLAHLCGMSVGREGVAVQIGGAFGSNFGNNKFFNFEEKNFLIRLGMICGFAALFHSYLTAVVFVLELLWQKKKIKEKIFNVFWYIIFSYYASWVSLSLGLEKFYTFINVDKSFFLSLNYLKVFIFEIILIVLATLFTLCRKQVKNFKYTYLILFSIFTIIIVTEGRYNSLGTIFINDIFNNSYNFRYEDFILKFLLTILCTGIGFSGGEVTNLFAIGSLVGYCYATMLDLPVIIFAALGYVLMFATSARLTIVPVFLAYEVFGWELSLLILFPSILIALFNKKYSIY